MAHAFKHDVSGHVASAHQPLKADEVMMRSPGFFDVAFSDLSRFDDLTGGVTLEQEREIDLLAVVEQAAAFLRAQLQGCRSHITSARPRKKNPKADGAPTPRI